MRMTLKQAFEMIERKETPAEFEKRMKRIRRLANERDELTDKIGVLEDFGNSDKDMDRLTKAKKRLAKVLEELEKLN